MDPFSLIAAGTSITGVGQAFLNTSSSIKFKLEVANATNKTLSVHEAYNHNGYHHTPAEDIGPGVKEAMFGGYVPNTTKGCYGTLSWKIGDTNQIIVVMYSAPYSFDWHSNYLGVWIGREQPTEEFAYKMYYGGKGYLKEFYYDGNPIHYPKGDYHVWASMGQSHQPEIVVRIAPREGKEHLLADDLKDQGVKLYR